MTTVTLVVAREFVDNRKVGPHFLDEAADALKTPGQVQKGSDTLLARRELPRTPLYGTIGMFKDWELRIRRRTGGGDIDIQEREGEEFPGRVLKALTEDCILLVSGVHWQDMRVMLEGLGYTVGWFIVEKGRRLQTQGKAED